MDSGEIEISFKIGKVEALIELFLGFHPYRDAQGRKQGFATTDRYGKTTYRDAQGRITGTSTTDRYGKTAYRDAQGRIQGSKK